MRCVFVMALQLRANKPLLMSFPGWVMGTASFFFCCCFLTNCHYAVPFLVLLPLFFFSSLFVSLNLLNVVIRFVFSATNFRAIQQLPCSFFFPLSKAKSIRHLTIYCIAFTLRRCRAEQPHTPLYTSLPFFVYLILFFSFRFFLFLSLISLF